MKSKRASFRERVDRVRDELIDFDVRQRVLILVETAITFIAAAVATIISFIKGESILGFITLGYTAFMFVFLIVEFILFAMRKVSKNGVFLYINFGLTYALVILYLIFAPKNGMFLYWIVSFPIILCFVGGFKKGLLFSLLLLIICILFFYVPLFVSWTRGGEANEGYETFKVLFIVNYLLTTLLGAVVAYINDTIIKRLNVLKEDYYRDANTDITTGLKNQLYFLSYIQNLPSELEEGDTIGLMFIDVDDFKVFNDKYGHMVGNKVLIKVANKLNEVPHSLLVRWGGDEFAIIERNISKDEFVAKANYLLKSVEGLGSGITISIGLAYYVVDENFDFNKVFNDADMKTIRAKDKGKNCIVFNE